MANTELRSKLFINHTRMEAMSLLENYLEIDELAAELGVTVRTLYRWHSLGFGPPKTKVGNRVVYNAESVRRWLKDHERQPVRN